MNTKTALLVSVLLVSQQADAHLVSTRFGEFYSGLLHPITTFMHVIPWAGMALLGAQQVRSYSRWLLIIFPLAVTTGVFSSSFLPEIKWLNLINLGSFVLPGLLVILSVHLPKQLFIGIALIFGFTHGFANGVNNLSLSGYLLYISGVGTAAYILTALLMAHARWLSEKLSWGAIALRVVGSWILAIGFIFFGFTLLNPVVV